MQFVAKGNIALKPILEDENVRRLMEDPEQSFRLLDLEGNYVVVSNGAQQITGYEPFEYIKLNSLQMTHPEDRPMIADAMVAVVDGPVEAVGRGIHKDGHIVWARVRAMVLQGFIAVALQDLGEPAVKPFWHHIDPFV